MHTIGTFKEDGIPVRSMDPIPTRASPSYRKTHAMWFKRMTRLLLGYFGIQHALPATLLSFSDENRSHNNELDYLIKRFE